MSISESGIAACTIIINNKICDKVKSSDENPVITISLKNGTEIIVEQTIHIAPNNASLVPLRG